MVSFASTATSASGRSNRRAEARSALPESVAYLSEHRLLIARVGDVSAGGAFLRTLYPDPVGTRATLDLELRGARSSIAVEVVRVSFAPGSTGMGVRFLGDPPPQTRLLRVQDPV